MSTTTLTDAWVSEPLPPSTDVLLRLRHLEAHVQALELAVRDLARARDRTDERAAAQLIRETLDGVPPVPQRAR
ncbi:hypothetical protein Daura_17955 [Dactylosporangium aurantiacum]|uniref:Uncharacterized protein n=1 Tax=Dactylosporangium aurantiacum TaxID=35754 RepID=A0A9Q9IKL4_9ACTN|nr:hypothetical protein [Dactylosporangium aurantiacum]MDG6110138.1 hypothetical protein [Dactylosporangium aurantiacum]UWZ57884.1 hypothetical protein Daura_17955 [Dactylosporangium aurantiacum]